jgi:hypothetical protein
MAATVAALEVVLQREQAPAMEELRRELAAARALLVTERRDYANLASLADQQLALNSDLQRHVSWLTINYDGELEELVLEKVELEQRLSMAERQLAQARADNLSDSSTFGSGVEPRRLLTWRECIEQEYAYRRDREAELADCANRLMRWASQGGTEEDVPDEVFRVIQIMRGNEYASDDEADDEMAVDSAAAP